jgi:hypothetical protein
MDSLAGLLDVGGNGAMIMLAFFVVTHKSKIESIEKNIQVILTKLMD